MSSDQRLEHELNAVLDGVVAGDGRVVGGVLRVTRDGETAYVRAWGYRDRDARAPMREDAIFRLASMTKQIVAAATLAMIERGKLSLDDPVTRALPDFRPKLKDGAAPEITVRHLLTHTSGLTYGFVQPEGHAYHRANVSDGLDQPGLSMEENLRRIASVPLEFAPGTGWGYSVGIDVLGALIAAVNGGTLAEAVAEYVTGPLGMTDTRFEVTDTDRLVPPYADGTPPLPMTDPQRVVRPEDRATVLVFSPSRVFDQASFQSGGAGMNGTSADYTRFMEALRTGGGPVLKPETVAMAAANQIGAIPRDPRDAGLRSGFFGGLVADPKAAGTPQGAGTMTFGGAWGHTGFLDRSRNLTVLSLTNTAAEGVGGTFPVAVRDAVYRALGG